MDYSKYDEKKTLVQLNEYPVIGIPIGFIVKVKDDNRYFCWQGDVWFEVNEEFVLKSMLSCNDNVNMGGEIGINEIKPWKDYRRE